MAPVFRVEDSENIYGPTTEEASTPLDAVEAVLEAWGWDRETTYDGEEIDCVVTAEDGSRAYFRGTASVTIRWNAVQIEGPEEDEI